MANLTFLGGWSNYFDRRIRRDLILNDWSGYLHELQQSGRTNYYVEFQGINFNPADSVDTELIVNWPEDWNPDYMIEIDDHDHVLARWFVIDFERTRLGQYNCTLRRDVIADNYNQIMSAPTFVEKAMVSASDPMILNPEGMTYNQIKKDEILLKDETGMPWIVGYVVQDGKRYPEGSGYYESSINLKTSTLKSEFPTYLINAIDDQSAIYFASYKDTDPNIKYELMFKGSDVGKYGSIEISKDWQYFEPKDFPGADPTSSLSWETEFENDASKISGVNNVVNNTATNNTCLFLSTDDYKTTNKNIITKMMPLMSSTLKTIRYFMRKESSDALPIEQWEYIKKYNNTVYYDETSKHYYSLQFFSVHHNHPLKFNYNSTSSLWGTIKGLIQNDTTLNSYLNRTASDDIFTIECPYDAVFPIVTDLGTSDTKISTYIPATRNPLVGEPFDMFCIPYGDFKCSKFTCNKELSLAIARSLAVGGAGSVVYDVQLLPYCPFRDVIKGNSINENLLTLDVDYTYAKNTVTGSNIGIIFWCTKSSFSFNINKSLELERPKTSTSTTETQYYVFDNTSSWDTDNQTRSYFIQEMVGKNYKSYALITAVADIENNPTPLNNVKSSYDPSTYTLKVGPLKKPDGLTLPTTIYVEVEFTYDEITTTTVYDNPLNLDIKINNECNFYRLNSPNYNAAFDFTLTKNDNSVDFFNVDCTYKPFDPYIHVNPNFKGLYGKDWDDARGLICSGDFSISLVTNNFENYKLNNKNYQQMFNRQIQSLDTNYKINLGGQIANDLSGIAAVAISAGATAAASGAKAGAGVIKQAGAGAWDQVKNNPGFNQGLIQMGIGYAQNALKHKEQRSFQTDMFNYYLGNVQAIPNALAKNTAFTFNNKLFPFIEFYSCTDVEKEALKEKIKYNSMTVMKVGTIGQYMNYTEQFIKGQVIRLPDVIDDAHIANEIYNEINKGVFIYG